MADCFLTVAERSDPLPISASHPKLTDLTEDAPASRTQLLTISRGNSVVRYTFIEMAWRFLRWQPQYPPIQKLRKGLFLSRRARRRLIVAAARRLAIDLWRWATARASAQELGLVLEQR